MGFQGLQDPSAPTNLWCSRNGWVLKGLRNEAPPDTGVPKRLLGIGGRVRPLAPATAPGLSPHHTPFEPLSRFQELLIST